MDLLVYKTMWGAVGSGAPYPTLQEAIPAAAADGFDGVSFALIALESDPGIGTLQDLGSLCEASGLGLVTMVMTDGDDAAAHLASLQRELGRVEGLPLRHVVVHSGADHFDREAARRFFAGALDIEKAFGVPLAHETHRTRILYNPWTTAAVVDEFPELHLAVDLSHWVVVSERLIGDSEGIIRRVADQTIHIDARVGYEEGPQVPDPRAPEWELHLRTFERWWEIIWERQDRAGASSSLVVPEYGPPPYQQTLPYTATPTTDLWDVCNWAADRLRRRFAERVT